MIVIFYGIAGNSALGDLRAIAAAKEVSWTAGQTRFHDVFDWDLILVNENSVFNLSLPIDLCTKFFPCALHLRGKSSAVTPSTKRRDNTVQPPGLIQRSNNGYISCYGINGCLRITFESMQILCKGLMVKNAVLVSYSSELNLRNTSFYGCYSEQDGGAILSNNANVAVEFSSFQNIRSKGFGGAIAAHRSRLTVKGSSFLNCSSKMGGGAIKSGDVYEEIKWGKAQKCPDLESDLSSFAYPYSLVVSGSEFYDCRSDQGHGGAVLTVMQSADNKTLDVQIRQSRFMQCNASLGGGAILLFGRSVNASVQTSNFTGCKAFGANGGGAIGSYRGRLSISSSSFHSCEALVGGALGLTSGTTEDPQYLGSAVTEIMQIAVETSVFHNCKSSGSGGAIFATSMNAETNVQGSTPLEMRIDRISFMRCTAGSDVQDAVAYGGAIRASGYYVSARLLASNISECTAQNAGGAVSITDGASIIARSSTFKKNLASTEQSTVHIRNAFWSKENSTCTYNNVACTICGQQSPLENPYQMHESKVDCIEECTNCGEVHLLECGPETISAVSGCSKTDNFLIIALCCAAGGILFLALCAAVARWYWLKKRSRTSRRLIESMYEPSVPANEADLPWELRADYDAIEVLATGANTVVLKAVCKKIQKQTDMGDRQECSIKLIFSSGSHFLRDEREILERQVKRFEPFQVLSFQSSYCSFYFKN
jgi:hypothetical protein